MGLAPDAELLAFVAELRTGPPRGVTASLAPPPATARALEADVPGEASVHGPPPDAESAPTTQPSRAAVSAQFAESAQRRLPVRRIAATLALVIGIAVAAVLLRGAQRTRADAGIQAIAVLPFADQSAGREYEYFADGMTEELMARLAHVDGLDVVGRTSVFAFKDHAIDVREIASRLNVTAVLQGSVRHSGDRLRIVAQLIDARNGYQLWTETYEREIEDVFAIQDDISRQIVTRLRGESARANASPVKEPGLAAVDPDAFNLYLKGRYEWHRRTEHSLRAAADYFRQAVERAPDYARAHDGLGDAYAVLGFYDLLPPRDAFPAAADAARRALELQPSLVEPHATLGYVALYHEWDWPRAEREFRRAIDLDRGYSTAHQWYANFLTAMGRFDEASVEMGAAMELDPLSVIANAALGWVLYYAGDYQRAIDQCTRALELSPDFALAYLWRGLAREELGDVAAGLHDLEQAIRLSDGSAIHIALHARALASAGQRDRARALMQQLEARATSDYVPPYEMAKLHEALGDIDTALRSLEAAYDHRSHSMAFLAVDPQLAGLRNEPRFRRLIDRVGLDHTPGGRRLVQ
jgi:TolB-like protein/Tfp pilus assembly protein PilF